MVCIGFFWRLAIHDGARCLITPEDIRKVCRAAVRYRAATAAHSVTDSVKLVNNRGFIEKSVDRKKVFLFGALCGGIALVIMLLLGYFIF